MNPPTFIDIFCGAGGLSLGLQMAGWENLLAIDNWNDALDTYQANFPNHKVLNIDIKLLTKEKLLEKIDSRPEWIVGGAPCQGFSTIGKREREDPRNALVMEFKRIITVLKPGGFILENVLGLKDMQFEGPVSQLFMELGYKVSSMVLVAANYGIPQLRRRIIFVGHREKGYFQGPIPNYSARNYITVWDAIGDLPEIGPGETIEEYDKEPLTEYQRLLRKGSMKLQGHTVSDHPPELVKAISFIPDGGNRKSIPPEYQPKSGFHNSYSRLYSKAPAVAVTSNMGKPSATRCIHPFQNRGLTAREGARLQSFPDCYHFSGGIVSQRLQIANAVPPLLAQAIGSALIDEKQWTDQPNKQNHQKINNKTIKNEPKTVDIMTYVKNI